MQRRMKEHPLTKEEIHSFLNRAPVGRIATLNENGFPYVAPVHFVVHDGKIYFHGLHTGQKIKNLKRDPKVCFEIDEMLGILFDEDETSCGTNTDYNSVIITGNAAYIIDVNLKRVVLDKIVDKYTPHYSGRSLPEQMVAATGIVEISILKCTGKYFH